MSGRLLGGEEKERLLWEQGSAALKQLAVLRCGLRWSGSFKVLKKPFVTLSGPNKLGLGRGMMFKPDKQKHCFAHPRFPSLYFCPLAYTSQFSDNCKATVSCLYVAPAQRGVNGTWYGCSSTSLAALGPKTEFIAGVHLPEFRNSKVLAPIPSNKEKHISWPGCVSQDMEHHVEIMKNKIIMKGLMSGRTHLPIPTVAVKTDLHQIYTENKQDPNSRAVLHAIKSMVIRWSHQIHDTGNRDSAEPLLHGLHPDPQTEMNFWKPRQYFIYKQLQSPVLQKMIKILKAKEGSYYPASQDIFKEVEDAVVEDQDIELYLRPLEKYIFPIWNSHIREVLEMEFPKVRNLISSLLHTICLIWSHSEFYSMPARIGVLLQEFNLLIGQSRLYLSPEYLSKGETEETTEHVKIAKTTLKSFKDSFFSHRNRPESYFACGKEFKPWDFRSEMMFSRFDMFLNRLKIEEIFINLLEFQKLGKLEFSGIEGTIFSEQVCRMNEKFLESCEVFRKRTYDPSGYSNTEFEDDYTEFKAKTVDLDRCHASVLCVGFHDCYGLESIFKPVIMEIFSPNCNILLEMFYEELNNCRHIRDEHVKKVCQNAKIKDYVLVGSQWLCFCSNKQAKEGVLENPEAAFISQKYVEMLKFLDQYEDQTYCGWKVQVDETCFNLDQPLIKCNPEKGLLSVNFFPKIGYFDLVVQLYNRVIQTTEVEYPLTEKELRTIDDQLKEAEEICTWKGNLKLFKADSSSTSWDIYMEYTDDIVVNGLYNTVMHSLDFFLENTEESLKPTPLFQAQRVLNGTEIQFKPSLKEAGDGFYDLVDELLGDVFQVSAQVKRVAIHLGSEHYQNDMDNMFDLSEISQETMERVARSLASYASLWLEDQSEFIKQFLLHGRGLASTKMPFTDEVSQQPPAIKMFKEQIDIYELISLIHIYLYVQISKFEDSKIFRSWFKADTKPFKMSLLNIKKWSWMFKEYLLRFVIVSLTGLEEFIEVIDVGLQREVTEGGYCVLVEITGHLLAVKQRQTTADELFESLKEVVALLESYGQKMPGEVYAQLEELPEKWNAFKRAVSVKHKVTPLQASEVAVIRRKCTLLDANQELEVLEKEMLLMQESAKLFEVAILDYKQMKQCKVWLLKKVWDIGVYINSSIDDWAKTQWRQINVEQMDVELGRFAKSLDKEVHSWDVYSSLELKVKNLKSSLRAILELQNPAIRRHWYQVMNMTEVRLLVAEDTTLTDLLGLQLHEVEDEVQSIVGDTVKELGTEKVAHHLTKLFGNTADLRFQENIEESVNTALGMCRTEKEYVPFSEGCGTVHNYIMEAILAYEEKQREQWVFDDPAQVALTGSQIWWVSDVAMAFSRLVEGLASALKDCHKKQVTQLNALITMLLGELFSGDQKIMTICTIDVHAGDVVASLVAQKVTSSRGFAWLSQLCRRWDDGQHCFANICDAQFQYFYEYLGNTPQLVITPLTNRCYIILTSLHLTMSGAPAGPASTSKTETTKDLGRALGMMVYIFSCSEQMDYKSVGNIKGLVQRGAWGFGEFSRISVVLSAVAIQVKTIHDAIRNKENKFLFLGENITLKSAVGIFITMNLGYAGWTELPENPKALFRPCAMVVPDIELISEIMLVVEGFIDACLLARKFIALDTLCRELLSKNRLGFLWGLCAIKSVLVVAGSLKRGDKNRPEDEVLMRTLRDFSLPKIVTDDIPIFTGLISDLPTLDVPRKRKLQFEQMVKQSTLELHLQPEESFILRVVQLEELLAVCHSVVRNVGSEKSKGLKVLHHTYMNTKQKPVWNDVNPKVLTADEWFSFIHHATWEWKDDLLSSILRDSKLILPMRSPKWLVLDGDIDSTWIESLNTVMDDNKVLTLTSSEHVPMTPSMWLLYEVHHLRAATPATVSRAGIVYLNMGNLYVASWIETRRYQSEKANLTVLFDKYEFPYLEKLRTRFKTVTPIPENSMVQMLCSLLDCLLTPENVPVVPHELYEMYFVFACIWAFGGALSQGQLSNCQAEFSCWWLKKMKAVKFPSQGIVFNYYLDPQMRKFLPWVDKVPSPDVDPDAPLQVIFVHTSETARLKYFIDLLLTKGKPVMLDGNAGVGKTFVGDRLATLSKDYLLANIPFNYYTTSAVLQKMLEKKLEKKAGHNYGPAGNKKLLYFIDDLSMPEADRYGTVQPHALIWQHIDYGHWYDRKLIIKEIHNCQYIICMNPTAGSFTINPRLQRHFAVFALNFPSSDSLTTIYSKIVCFHFQQHAFTPSVIKNIPAIVQAAIWLQQAVVQNFPPTAIKFHYIFNVRDLSNAFQGTLFATPECLQQPNDLICLWLHESARVYGDKLVENKDCNFLHKMMTDTMHKYFEGNEGFHSPNSAHISQETNRCYKPEKGWEPLRNIFEGFLECYNEMHASMNLVLFEDAMKHVCWISLILEAPRGYALLIGVGGSGRQSLLRLAAYICSLEVFQIVLKKTTDYRIQDLRVDLASLYIKTGAKNMPTEFLLTDARVPDERFFVLINDLLASGEVTDLFSDEDMEGIVTGVRKEVALGLMDTRESCWRFSLSRVRLQLKIILCFPAGATLRVQARKFPAIVNCTSIDWFHEWPQEALCSISRRFIEEAEGVEPVIQDSIYDFMAYIHTSVNKLSAKNRNEKYNYTTPKTFLKQNIYKILLEKKSKEMLGHMEHLVNGMQKLKMAAFLLTVEDLKSKLASQEAELQLRNQDAEALIAKIGFQTEKVSQEKAIADAEEQKVAAIQGEVYLRQKKCEDDLLKDEPVLVAATAALDILNKVSLAELKAFTNPPVAVTNVIAAVMVLLAHKGKEPKDRSWKATKLLMGKVPEFLQGLINYDKEHIPQNCLKVVKEHYLKDPDFKPNYVHSKSFAAAGLSAWIINIVKFNEVYCEVEPKHFLLAQANADLAAATEKLEAMRKKLPVLDSNLCKLTASLEKAVAEKVQCQDDVNRTNTMIELANRLVEGLQSENMRWSQSVENLKAQKKTLCGDILFTAAFVSYFEPFTKEYRQELMEYFWIPFLKSQKVPFPVTEGLDPIATLTDDATIAAWSNEGLPGDRMSTENATILTNCECWLLMIDPQQQGIKWIKNKYGADLKVVHLGQKGYVHAEELAFMFTALKLLIESIESIDPILDPLLGRHTVKKGKYIKIEDKECEFNKNFHLILHTKLANPHYKPELQAQTTLINFTVTKDRLEDQLLAEVVSAERLDLEKHKSILVKQQNRFKTELRQLEDVMVLSLSAAQSTFLDDSELVEELKTTKSTAAEIQHKITEAKENAQINMTRKHYRPTAVRASILYFVSNSLGNINPIYQFSLKAFSAVFHKAIKQAGKSVDIQCHISNLTEAVTYSAFLYSQGLFAKDKLIFLATSFQVLLRSKEIELLELDFLLQFRVEHTYKSPVDFLTTQSWSAIRAMAVMDVFRVLDKDVEGSTKRWKKWVDSECPEKEKLPQEWTNKSSFQKLIILRSLCPDRMTYALRNFVEENLDSRYVESTRMDLAKSYEESSPATPVFFILSPGAAALEDIGTLGKKLGFTIDGRFHNISLGQGEMVAEEALKKAARHSHWVLLQNIYLEAKWLGTLEKLLEQYSEESHPDFRVFISAEPAPTPEEHIIPQGIPENLIKITSEPPTGMLANLHAALYSFDQDTLELCTREGECKSILFSLCYFHTCVAGRLKFGPQGCNGRYPLQLFRDYQGKYYPQGRKGSCLERLHHELAYFANQRVPWEDLRYFFGEIMYGGHITDAWDHRLCCIYLQGFLSPPVLGGELTLAPSFLAPPNLDYAEYHKIDEMLPSESPVLYGLHPNAEMGYLTAMSDNLFKTLLEMQPMNFIGEGSGQSAEEKVKNVLDSILEMLPEEFNMAEIMQTIAWSPYALVCLQECERMNLLLSEICRSLKQLDLALKGELMFSPHMGVLQSALFCDAVPDTWTKLAYPSTYSPAPCLNAPLKMLEFWTQDLVLPAVVWLFNPQSFLTAVMQSTTHKNNWPLDKVCLTVDVTQKTKDNYGHPPTEGAYIYGLFMQEHHVNHVPTFTAGARWDIQLGTIAEAHLKEWTPAMPVIFVRAIPVDQRETKNVYECPGYKTKSRGPTYVWTSSLKSQEKPVKWVLAGVALLLAV
ncbi:LOW QUALITY PROTEIN: dynein axonemal heavy chain 11 [Morus bassanus]